MKLLLRGHDDRYAVEQLQLALFPDEPMEPVDAPFSGDGAVSALHVGKTWLTATAELTLHGKTVRASRRLRADRADVPSRRRLLQNAYYDAAMQLRDPPEWGSLSGVRPTKLTTRCLLGGGTARDADRLLRERYHVSPARRRLCVEASLATAEAVKRLEPNDVSVYIGIPFCPTRCIYCSFVSASTEKTAGLLPQYLDALIRELETVGRLLAASGRRVRTLYIGGGTPTTLSTPQLRRLMDAIRTHFDLSGLIEYTVEGGRPDTLDDEKLRVLREGGCDRVSINPQTMNDAVLALAPSNVTVHTLALKRGAELAMRQLTLPSAEDVRQMLQYAERALRERGYAPYYLYRQKYMSGSFENVGWCKPGYAGLYNIYMMEELHSILSLGGGAMTKINLPDGTLERFHNPKFPQQYLARLDDVLAQKAQAFALLNRKEP